MPLLPLFISIYYSSCIWMFRSRTRGNRTVACFVRTSVRYRFQKRKQKCIIRNGLAPYFYHIYACSISMPKSLQPPLYVDYQQDALPTNHLQPAAEHFPRGHSKLHTEFLISDTDSVPDCPGGNHKAPQQTLGRPNSSGIM